MLIPTIDQTAITAAKAVVDRWFCQFNIPHVLLSDHGPAFESTLFKAVCKELGIEGIQYAILVLQPLSMTTEITGTYFCPKCCLHSTSQATTHTSPYAYFTNPVASYYLQPTLKNVAITFSDLAKFLSLQPDAYLLTSKWLHYQKFQTRLSSLYE